MNTGYDVIENNGRRMKILVKSTKREVEFTMPKFHMQGEINEIIKKANSKKNIINNALNAIAKKRKIKIDDVVAMMNSGEGLSEDEMISINEASKDTGISEDDMYKMISFVIVAPKDTDKIELIRDFDIDEGTAVASAAMLFLTECLKVDKEERKK